MSAIAHFNILEFHRFFFTRLPWGLFGDLNGHLPAMVRRRRFHVRRAVLSRRRSPDACGT